MPLIKATQEGFVGTIMLDHAEKRNTLSSELINETIGALDAFRADKLRAVVIRAQPGAHVFSAGYNILELPVTHRDPLGWDDPVRHLVRTIEEFPAPVIAMVEGGVWGGACEVVLASDIIVVAPNATFAITPAKLSVPYNISGMLTFLNAAPARAVREMAFTAKPVSAARAFDFGMVNHIVPVEELEILHLWHRARHRRERAARSLGHEGRAAHSRRRAPGRPARLRAHPGAAPHRLRQPRLCGGPFRLQGKAQAEFRGAVS